MTAHFELVTHSRHSPERLCEVSLSIDAHLSSMTRSGERAVAGVTSGQITCGESVTWRARHFGVMWTMTSRIEVLEAPHRFVDAQVAGPFRSFRHEHIFEPEGGGTRMLDRVALSAPLGGRLVERAVLMPYLRRLIRMRNRHLLTLLEA
nr:SRPBCC family protein [Brevibacterium album]